MRPDDDRARPVRRVLVVTLLASLITFFTSESDDYVSVFLLESSALGLGLLNAVGALGFLAAILIAGFVDRVGRKRAIIIACAVAIVASGLNTALWLTGFLTLVALICAAVIFVLFTVTLQTALET